MRAAIIPARGGSKRIPRKNIRRFAGKPMIAYAIEAARACELFDHVIVSTDDQEIADIAEGFGAKVPFRRPPELADDWTPTIPVIQHVIAAWRDLGGEITHACCIYPGVPFIQAADLTRGLELLKSQGGEGYVFPVTSFPSPIQRALRREENGKLTPFNPEHVLTRTQDLEPAYFDAGQFYWGGVKSWMTGISIHDHGHAIVIPEWRVVDIDTEEDWTRAELLYRALPSTGPA